MNTIIDLFERSCAKFPDNPYLWEKREGKYEALTYRKTKARVRDLAGGLLFRELKRGQRVAVFSEGCSDWVCSELAILYAGGCCVPLSVRLTEQELVFRLNHSGARFVFVSTYFSSILEKIRPQLESVEHIFVLGQAPLNAAAYISLGKFVKNGKRWLETHAGELERIAASVKEEELANISYTSGTTAEPKGVMLTHGNYVSNVLQADSLIRIPEHYKVLLFLPWDHSFAHTVGIYSFMYNGASLAAVDFGRSPMEFLRNISLNMREIKPHLLLSVPAVARNFRKNIEAEIAGKGKFTACIYRLGLQLGYWYYGDGNYKGKGIRAAGRPLVALFDSLIFKKIRKNFGGNLRYFIGGGALLDKELQRYYRALGIPMYQGYGLSEASPVISSNTPEHHKFGTSGLPVTPIELKICGPDGRRLPSGESGEIVVRGGNVMKGYWRNEESTAETLREGGWLYTGDLGYVDKQGYLVVQGRFKSLLIANDGEKYSPEGIEEAIVEKSPYIDYCILYNDQSPYTIGLVAPARTALKEYVKSRDLAPDSVEGYKLMLSKIEEELMEFRHGGKHAGLFPERWLPAVVAILPDPLNERNGTINSTGKTVHRKITELYREEIDRAYTVDGKDIQNVRNTRNIKKLMES